MTASFRAYFSRHKEDLGYCEVNEEARREGIRRALGELLTCNYCMDMWVGLGVLASLRKFPEESRVAMRLFSSVAIANFMHVLYEAIRTQENVLTLEENFRERKRAA